MNYEQQIQKMLIRILKTYEVSQREISRETGISQPTLSRIFGGTAKRTFADVFLRLVDYEKTQKVKFQEKKIDSNFHP